MVIRRYYVSYTTTALARQTAKREKFMLCVQMFAADLASQLVNPPCKSLCSL